MKTIARTLLIMIAVLTISLSWAGLDNVFSYSPEATSTWDAIDAVETSPAIGVSHRAQALKSAMMTGTLSCTSDVDQNGIPLGAYLNVGLITETLTCTIFLDANGFDITEFAWPLACEGEPLDFFWPGYSTYSYTPITQEITGAIVVDPFGVHTYSYPSNPSSVYLWLVDGGSIISGQGSSNVTVVWGDDGVGYLGVVEVLDGICPGELVSDMILIGDAVSVDMATPARWSTYPSPADGTINLESDLYQNQCEVKLFDFSGRVCHQGVMNGKRYTIDIGSLAEGVYILYAGRSAHKVVIKR